MKSKYEEKARLCYMDADCFMVYIKTSDVYKETVKDVETRFDTSNYKLDRPLPKKRNEKCCWFNGRWIRWENHEIICLIKSTKLWLLNGWSSED